MIDKPATFSATYADWKLIKTRRCVQIVLEVPLEAANEAYEALGGMPSAATERWVAVARLDLTAVQPTMEEQTKQAPPVLPASTSRQPAGHCHLCDIKTKPPVCSVPGCPIDGQHQTKTRKYNLAQRAGMLCADRQFQYFLDDQMTVNMKLVFNKDESQTIMKDYAAATLRSLCGVRSRSELIAGTAAGDKFEQLLNKFAGWRADLD
jgi:hypothetical protein